MTSSPVENILQRHREAFERTFDAENREWIRRAAETVVAALRSGRKILICGNGGSAADAQHIAAEFVVRYKKERPALPAVALHTDTSVLTAAANDYAFERVFARQVEALGAAGDVLIAISTSGNSPNVVAAAEAARTRGLRVLGLTAESGGKLAALCDSCFRARTPATAQAQEMHITALHAVCEIADEAWVS